MGHKISVYEGSEPYIFISYCHKDVSIAHPVFSMLSERGYRIWYDEGITPGDEWTENIANHLEGSSVFIAIVTEASLNSHNCRREINFAVQRNKEIIALYLEDVRMSPGMEMLLSSVQGIYRSKYGSNEDYVEKLCSSRAMEECRDPHHRPIPEDIPSGGDDETITLTQSEINYFEQDLETYLIRISTLEKIRISKNTFSMGRSEASSDYVLTGEQSLSRCHAIIRKTGSTYTITDNNSLNHSGLNGRMIMPENEYELADYDIVSLAKENLVFFRNYNEKEIAMLAGWALRSGGSQIDIPRSPIVRIGRGDMDGFDRECEINIDERGRFRFDAVLINSNRGIYIASLIPSGNLTVNDMSLRYCEKKLLREGDRVNIDGKEMQIVRRR